MADASGRGRFVWYDLMTTDPAKAQDFYSKVVGWGIQVWEGPKPYTMWTVDGTPIGGVMPKSSPGGPSHWLAYVSTPDVDATAKDAQARGAKLLVPGTDIPSVGRFAVLADPQGAALAIFTPIAGATKDQAAAKRGEFSWHELATTSLEDGFRFYQALFGWDLMEDHDMGPLGTYRIFGRNGVQLGGMFNKPPQIPAPNWLLYVLVDDAARAAERVTANGGSVLNGPMEVPGGDWIAQCLDPQGAAFAVQSRAK